MTEITPFSLALFNILVVRVPANDEDGGNEKKFKARKYLSKIMSQMMMFFTKAEENVLYGHNNAACDHEGNGLNIVH